MNIFEKLTAVQAVLKAPKSQYNAFGKYAYRNCEDILEAVKPLLAKNKLAMTISDEVEIIGERHYITATVTLYDCESDCKPIVVTASAREEESKKGMDGSQVTGASSSYARKYALNGLFAIDDTKDSDTTNTHGNEPKAEPKTESKPKAKAPAKPSADNTDYRGMMIRLLKEQGIDPGAYAQEHGINKDTTAEQFKAICETLKGANI